MHKSSQKGKKNPVKTTLFKLTTFLLLNYLYNFERGISNNVPTLSLNQTVAFLKAINEGKLTKKST